jgi:hypothetical protein
MTINATSPAHGAAGLGNCSLRPSENSPDTKQVSSMVQELCVAALLALGEPARLALLIAALGEQLSVAVSLLGRAAR